MIKDRCCREINDSLQRTFAKSVLNTFASNLGININNDGTRQHMIVKDKDVVEEEKDVIYSDDEESIMNEAEDEKNVAFTKYHYASKEKDMKT